jgi:ADP-L-glycero-D-manno-heptose 6-epimerase
MFSAAGIEPNIEFIDMPAGLIERYQYFTEARLERLRSAGYTQPFTSLETGVAEYIQSYLGRDDPYH